MKKYNLKNWIKEYKIEYDLSNKCISDLKKVFRLKQILNKSASQSL